GPRKLANNQRPNHATTALEGVEGPTHFSQRFLVLMIGMPARQVFIYRLKDLGGFLDEDFKQLIIDRFLVRRWRQQTRRNVLRWRVDGRDRCGHNIIETQ